MHAVPQLTLAEVWGGLGGHTCATKTQYSCAGQAAVTSTASAAAPIPVMPAPPPPPHTPHRAVIACQRRGSALLARRGRLAGGAIAPSTAAAIESTFAVAAASPGGSKVSATASITGAQEMGRLSNRWGGLAGGDDVSGGGGRRISGRLQAGSARCQSEPVHTDAGTQQDGVECVDEQRRAAAKRASPR
jgi:hypothetical protein